MSADNTQNDNTPAQPTVEQRIARALDTKSPRSLTMLLNRVGRPRVAKAKVEAALEGMVKGGAVALIPAPPATGKRGRPAVAKFLSLIPAPVASTPASDATPQ